MGEIEQTLEESKRILNEHGKTGTEFSLLDTQVISD